MVFNTMKIRVTADAQIGKDGSIILTDGLHETGRVTISNKIDISNKSWKLSAIVSMSDNKGISDSDGVGGDGIWFEFNERTFSIGLDTFQNEYNDSGNEINLFVEGQVVAKKHCPIKFNSGEKIKIDILCRPSPKTMIVVAVDNKPILTHALQTTVLSKLLPEKAEFSMFAFTGDAGSKQIVHEVEIKYLSTDKIL